MFATLREYWWLCTVLGMLAGSFATGLTKFGLYYLAEVRAVEQLKAAGDDIRALRQELGEVNKQLAALDARMREESYLDRTSAEAIQSLVGQHHTFAAMLERDRDKLGELEIKLSTQNDRILFLLDPKLHVTRR